MELLNSTRMVAGYTLGLEPDGRESLVVVVKGTFRFPTEQGARLQLDEEQLPLLTSDVFFGPPGASAPRYEVDFAPCKRACDILLNGHAYAPGGRPCERVTVGVAIGAWSKSIAVVGDRVWFTSGGPRSTAPAPFVQMPLSYDQAFGGTDQRHEDPRQHAAFMPNPSGRGFHKHLVREWLDGTPLPNTEEVGKEVCRPDDTRYRPMSFGAVGRHWEPRYRFAGTYDDEWRERVFPFLPKDFDALYYQAAPADQQLALPVGEQRVVLLNLTPEGHSEFVLPHFEAPIHVFPRHGEREDLLAPLDTVLIEPDERRVTLTWRVARPLKRDLFEIGRLLVGRKGQEWWQQRERLGFPIPVVMEPMHAAQAEAGGPAALSG